MEHDRVGVDSGQLRDQREEAVEERERVAGMEPAVAVLVDAPQRDRAEVDELAHAAEVEERVAAVGRDPPERDSGREAERQDREAPRGDAQRAASKRERRRGEPRAGHDRGREPDRAVHREHHRHPREKGGEAPDEGRRRALEPKGARDERARNQQAGRCSDQPEAEPDSGRGREP